MYGLWLMAYDATSFLGRDLRGGKSVYEEVVIG